MMNYSIEPRDLIFVKDYGFLFFIKNMAKTLGKNISKILGGKYSQKLLDHGKESGIDAIETASEKPMQKRKKITGDLVGNKDADKITKVSKSLPQNNSKNETEIPK